MRKNNSLEYQSKNTDNKVEEKTNSEQTWLEQIIGRIQYKIGQEDAVKHNILLQ